MIRVASARTRWLPVLAGLITSASPARSCGSAGGTVTSTGRRESGASVAVPGGKPAVIYFFTAGCSQGAPAVAAAQHQAPGATYVAVDLDSGQSEARARGVLRSTGAADTGLAVSTDTSLVAVYGVSTLGTTVVIDATGKTVYTGVEASTSDITSAVATAEQHL